MKTKKRIAVIGVKGLPGFGGGARSTEALLTELKDQFDISVYAINTHTNVSGDYKGLNQIVFKGLPSKRFNTLYYYFKSMMHCLTKGKYDVIHVQHIYAGFIIPFLRLKYPVINTVRGIIPPKDNKWNALDKFSFRIFEYLSLKFSNTSVSVCNPHIPYLKSVYNREILYIPNGVHIFKDILSKKQSSDYICFSAGRIIGLKGCHIFLEALHKIGYKGRVVIIGSIDHVKSYGEQIKELSKGLNVEFLGLIKEKEKLFEMIANAKLFVFPSLNEGMSNMLLEAASLQTPIIASDIIENKEIFDESEVLFFKSGSSDDLSEKLLESLNHYETSLERAGKAFEKVIKEHDWKKIGQQYAQLYNIELKK